MSGLPEDGASIAYSEADIQHIVARRLAAIQLQQLADGQIALQLEMRKEIAEIKMSIKELVDAWNSAGGMVRMVKYVASLVTALIILVAFTKGYFK